MERSLDGVALFALDASRPFGERVADALGLPLSPHEERDFEDGEFKVRSLEEVHARSVHVIHALHGEPGISASDKLSKLLFMIGALKEAGASRVTAICPYLCFARKDRQTQPRDPVSTRYVAQLFEAVGTDRVVTIDVHNLAAYQNAFRCSTEHLEALPLFLEKVGRELADREVAVVSPDIGGAKRARRCAEALEAVLRRDVGTAFVEKKREGGVVTSGALTGEIEGRVALVLDDLISSGTTIVRAARACRSQGAISVIGAATHGLFNPPAGDTLADDSLDEILVADTVPPFRLQGSPAADKVTVLPAAPIFARAIELIETGSGAQISRGL